MHDTDAAPAATASTLPVGHTGTLATADVLDRWAPGPDWDWTREFSEQVLSQNVALHVLMEDVDHHGMTSPVLLGDDGHVWEGHRLLLVARILGLPSVRVEYGWGSEPADVVSRLVGAADPDPVDRGAPPSLLEAITYVVEQTREDVQALYEDQHDLFVRSALPHLDATPRHRILARVNALNGVRRVYCETCDVTLLVMQDADGD